MLHPMMANEQCTYTQPCLLVCDLIGCIKGFHTTSQSSLSLPQPILSPADSISMIHTHTTTHFHRMHTCTYDHTKHTHTHTHTHIHIHTYNYTHIHTHTHTHHTYIYTHIIIHTHTHTHIHTHIHIHTHTHIIIHILFQTRRSVALTRTTILVQSAEDRNAQTIGTTLLHTTLHEAPPPPLLPHPPQRTTVISLMYWPDVCITSLNTTLKGKGSPYQTLSTFPHNSPWRISDLIQYR